MVNGKITTINRRLIHLQQLHQTVDFVLESEYFDSDERMELVDGLKKEITTALNSIVHDLNTARKLNEVSSG